MKIKIVTILAFVLLLMSCEGMFDPKNENLSERERIYRDAGFAEGLLMSAYTRVPIQSLGSPTDVATDNAVTNDRNSNYLRMGTGQWSATFDPVSVWNNCNTAMLFLDQFISIIDTVQWKRSAEVNSLFQKRFKGEAYALRGIIQYHLLQTIAGYGESGTLLGTPFYRDDNNFNIPRRSFAESVEQIYRDFDTALEYLTMDDYKDLTSESELPPGYAGYTVPDYNLIFGKTLNQRVSGRIVKAYKARLALLEASPAFSPNNDEALWEKAANYAGQILETIGGVSGLDSKGHIFYQQAQVDGIDLASTGDLKEIIWRRPIAENRNREEDNFPPSLYGRGRINPSQNLVDAFPMANGMPITADESGYDATNPYAGRDPRLKEYIAYNGNTVAGVQILTRVGGGTNAKDSIATSTRTGYYMKKLLREDVSLNPTGPTNRKHFEVYMRYTELFLIYAEAANEAWGPDQKGSFSFSAREVIAAIRKRGGITTDTYLSAVTTKEQMRELIRNERRIELCFEGVRFWDLRRWKADLSETVKGININYNGSIRNIVNVEDRIYDNDYMHYAPLPRTEVVKLSALEQNKGW